MAAIAIARSPAVGNAWAQAARPSHVAEEYRMERVADGIYVFVAPLAYGGIVAGNSTVVIGDSAVLVVDSGHFPALARRMIADIRKLTSKPIRYLVNTHWHPDHWLGNGEYVAAYPALDIIGTAFTRDQIREQWPQISRQYSDSAAAFAQLQKIQSSQLLEDGQRYMSATLTDAPAALNAWRGARLAPPTRIVDDELDLDLGHRVAKVLFLGGGNTQGDLVVYVPDARVVATGDLVVAPTPYAYPPAPIANWITTLSRLQAVHAATIVPGHGPVEHNASYLELVTDALKSLQTQVSTAVRGGLSLDSTRRVVDLKDYEMKFAGSDAALRSLFRTGFVVPGVEAAFLDAKRSSGDKGRP